MVADVGGDEKGQAQPPLAWSDQDHRDGEDRTDGACDHEDLFTLGTGIGVGAYKRRKNNDGKKGGGDAYGPEGVASLLIAYSDGFEIDRKKEGDDEEGEGLIGQIVKAPGEDLFGVLEVLEEFGHWGMVGGRWQWAIGNGQWGKRR